MLVLTMHHIITDGWSFRVLLRDLGLIYRALERGEPMPLAELPIQYPDYAQWQRDRLHGAEFDAHIDFWRHDLAGVSPLELDTDRPRPEHRRSAVHGRSSYSDPNGPLRCAVSAAPRTSRRRCRCSPRSPQS